jgi:DNA-binding GntR family transcriptional regulator
MNASKRMIEPIHYHTLNEQVYRRLKKAFLSGHFLPGQVLTIRGLAEELNCSMMPVRDAISRLGAEHAFDSSSRFIRIPTLGRSATEDLWQLRILLEGKAAGIAAERVNKHELAEIARLRNGFRTLAEQEDLHGFLERNDSLQFAIYTAAHSDVLIHVIETLRMRAAPQCTVALAKIFEERPPYFNENFAFEEQLFDALVRHDSRTAIRMKRADLRGLRDMILVYAVKDGDDRSA